MNACLYCGDLHERCSEFCCHQCCMDWYENYPEELEFMEEEKKESEEE
jgi:hypothetical protein